MKEDSVDKQPVKDESTKGFTAEQMQKLLRLLDDTEGAGHNINQIQRRDNDSNRNSQGNNLWILDTGATDHVTHNKNCFTTFFRIKPVKIKLPNNNDVIAYYAGTVQFCDNLILFNVLYVPEFHFNLISVQTLIKDLNCKLIFSSKCCQIQDTITSQMIGQANLSQGLYYLDIVPVTKFTNFFPNIVLNCSKIDIDT